MSEFCLVCTELSEFKEEHNEQNTFCSKKCCSQYYKSTSINEGILDETRPSDGAYIFDKVTFMKILTKSKWTPYEFYIGVLSPASIERAIWAFKILIDYDHDHEIFNLIGKISYILSLVNLIIAKGDEKIFQEVIRIIPWNYEHVNKNKKIFLWDKNRKIIFSIDDFNISDLTYNLVRIGKMNMIIIAFDLLEENYKRFFIDIVMFSSVLEKVYIIENMFGKIQTAMAYLFFVSIFTSMFKSISDLRYRYFLYYKNELHKVNSHMKYDEFECNKIAETIFPGIVRDFKQKFKNKDQYKKFFNDLFLVWEIGDKDPKDYLDFTPLEFLLVQEGEAELFVYFYKLMKFKPNYTEEIMLGDTKTIFQYEPEKEYRDKVLLIAKDKGILELFTKEEIMKHYDIITENMLKYRKFNTLIWFINKYPSLDTKIYNLIFKKLVQSGSIQNLITFLNIEKYEKLISLDEIWLERQNSRNDKKKEILTQLIEKRRAPWYVKLLREEIK